MHASIRSFFQKMEMIGFEEAAAAASTKFIKDAAVENSISPEEINDILVSIDMNANVEFYDNAIVYTGDNMEGVVAKLKEIGYMKEV